MNKGFKQNEGQFFTPMPITRFIWDSLPVDRMVKSDRGNVYPTFKESNYLMYYFAESNCISLRKVIKNVNTWYRCYNLDAIEALSPNDLEAENLFRRLPVEFRNTYDNLRDIHSANMLYKYSYEAFADGQKLQKVIESGTTEFGMTSSGKAICRVNDYLRFL